MLKSKGKTCMVEDPSRVKQLSLHHVCDYIGIRNQNRNVSKCQNSYGSTKLNVKDSPQNKKFVINVKIIKMFTF
jgi:hypothetical protein